MAAGTVAAVGAMTAGTGMLFNSFLNASNSSVNREMSQNNFETSMAFNAEESQKNRDWQEKEWDRRFKIESEYNTPAAQVGRLADIGLNSQSLYGDSGNAGQIFGMSSTPASAPAQSPVPAYAEMKDTTFVDVLNSLSNLVGNAAGAFKDTAEGKSIAATIDGMVQNLELKNQAQALDNGSKQIDLIVKSSTSLTAAWTDIKLKFSQVQLNAIMGKMYDSEALLNDSQRFLTDAQKKLSDKEYEKLCGVMPYVIMAAKANVDTIKSEAERNRADAYKSTQEGDEANARRQLVDVQKNLAKIEEKIKQHPEYKKYVIEQMKASCKETLSRAKLNEAERKKVLELQEQLSKENAWYNFNQIWSKVNDIADIGLDAYRSITFQNFFNSESSRRKAKDEFERSHYGDVTETDETNYYDSAGRKHKASVSRKRAPFGKH